MNPTVSVIIPIHDQAPRLRLVLLGLQGQAGVSPGDYEVIVVDDESSDGVDRVVQAARAEARHTVHAVRCSSRGARGVPRNIGARIARGELLVFLDADAFPSKDLLHRHLAAHDRPDQLALGDLRVVPATEMLLDPADGTPFPSRGADPPVGSSFRLSLAAARDGAAEVLEPHAQKGLYPGLGLWCRQVDEMLVAGDVPFAWAGAIPHNLSTSRATFLRLGGFDPLLPHSEGWDLGIRALRTGCAMKLAAGATSYHLYHRRDAAATFDGVFEAERILHERYPDDFLDIVRLWFDACAGSDYLPAEANLANWRELARGVADPEERALLRRLHRWSRQVARPPIAAAYLLDAAINSPFAPDSSP